MSELKINDFAKEVHENAVKHGWWDEERSFGEIIALCHSELSEALEEYRGKKDMLYCNVKKPEGIAVEMADCIIRILDWAAKNDIDLEFVMQLKHKYNVTRPYRHGGKVI